MPDPLLPGKAGLYLSMLSYGLAHNRDFAREHHGFFEDLIGYLGDVRGARILDMGCGKSCWLSVLLNSVGAKVCGIDTEVVEPGITLPKYRHILRENGIERALRTLIWELIFAKPYYRELADIASMPLQFDKLDLRIADSCDLPFEDDTFDFVVSHEVFEHIADIPGTFAELARVLKPTGRTYIYVHNFTSLSGGHHIAWKYPDEEPSKVIPPWDHLREKTHTDIPSWLNEMREHEYREIAENHLEILDWIATAQEGAGLLSHEIRSELSMYETRELLTKGFIIVGTPKKPDERQRDAENEGTVL